MTDEFPEPQEALDAAVRKVAWDQCDAYARSHNEETGRERELFCTLGRHSAPGDATEEHYDEDLDVCWRWADDN